MKSTDFGCFLACNVGDGKHCKRGSIEERKMERVKMGSSIKEYQQKRSYPNNAIIRVNLRARIRSCCSQL